MNDKKRRVSLRIGIVILVVLTPLFLLSYANNLTDLSSKIKTYVFDTGGGKRNSTSYKMRDTIGQSSAIGVSQSASFKLHTGFQPAVIGDPVTRTTMKGDVNSDGRIDVTDALMVINIILGNYNPTQQEMRAADINGDGLVNIADVVSIVNTILGIGSYGVAKNRGAAVTEITGLIEDKGKVNPSSTSAAKGSAGDILLDETDGHLKRSSQMVLPVAIKSNIPIAGAQIKLQYKGTTVVPGKPQLTERGANMLLASNTKEDELIILVYSTDQNVIRPGSEPILSVPFEVEGSENDSTIVSFKEVILVNRHAQQIPLEIKSVSKGPDILLPKEFALAQNYPNPFNPETTIKYQLPKDSYVRLDIFNIMGQKLTTLIEEHQSAGFKTVKWDGRDSSGFELASGLYFYRIKAGDFVSTKKMTLIR